MVRPYFVTGEAGAGKTRRLMEQAVIASDQFISKPYQRALAMAVMHGARRQLQLTLKSFCPELPVTISTVHSFALKIVNRWRRCVGLAKPVTICEISILLAERHERTQATFEEVIRLACELLKSATVQKAVAELYPLVIVDEFQDCTGGTLSFIQALGSSSKLLLAADPFQLLTTNVEGCAAVNWINNLRKESAVEYVELNECHRTNVTPILDASRALRDGVKATQCTIPVYHGYQSAQVACRIVERFRGWGHAKQITDGTCALIVLSVNDVHLQKLLESFKRQLERKTSRRVHWPQSVSEEQQQKALFEELEISPDVAAGTAWHAKQEGLRGMALAVYEDVTRFAKLRGFSTIPQEIVLQFARLAVHNARAFSKASPRSQILTVHAAKNREFDHVFIFWSYKNAGWSDDEQRKLLYNAVTRAKVDCTVLVLGGSARADADPAISLLGPAMPAIDPAWKKKKKKAKPKPKA